MYKDFPFTLIAGLDLVMRAPLWYHTIVGGGRAEPSQTSLRESASYFTTTSSFGLEMPTLGSSKAMNNTDVNYVIFSEQ